MSGHWLRVQTAYDTEIAEESLEDQLKNIRPSNSGPGIRLAHPVGQAYPGHVLELLCVIGDDH